MSGELDQEGDLAFDALAARLPELRELEAEAKATVDDGTGTFFCSNFVWLPLSTRLRAVFGESEGGSRRPGEQPSAPQGAWRAAYEYLSSLIPPCRDCGCRAFRAHMEREGQLKGRD